MLETNEAAHFVPIVMKVTHTKVNTFSTENAELNLEIEPQNQFHDLMFCDLILECTRHLT